MFGPSHEDLNEAHKQASINACALVTLLVHKGVFSFEEWEQARMQATSAVDQMFQQQRDDAILEVVKENPGLKILAKRIRRRTSA